MGHTLDTVNRYYNAVTNGGSGLEDLIAKDISFVGPMAQFSGAEAFEAGIKEIAPALRGIEMIRQFEDGDEVCSVYELHLRTPGGDLAVPASEPEFMKTFGATCRRFAPLTEFLTKALDLPW